VPPVNDSFASATTLTDSDLPYHVTYVTVDATVEAGEPTTLQVPTIAGPVTLYTLTRTVWYSYTPASDGLVCISTSGSSFPAAVVVYTGSSLGALTRVAASARYGGTSRGALRLDLVGGTTYKIQIGRTGAAATTSLEFWLSRMPSAQVRGTLDAPSEGETIYVPTDMSGSFHVAGTMRIDDNYAVGVSVPYQATTVAGAALGWTPSGQALMPTGGAHHVSFPDVWLWEFDMHDVRLVPRTGVLGFTGSDGIGPAPWYSYLFAVDVLFSSLPWPSDESTGSPMASFNAKIGIAPYVFALSPTNGQASGVLTSSDWFLMDMLTVWRTVTFVIGTPPAVPARLATIVG